jgi:hypothetical protein
MKKRTMERNVLYFMPAIVQQAKQSCGHAKHEVPRVLAMAPGNKKQAAEAACQMQYADLYLHL